MATTATKSGKPHANGDAEAAAKPTRPLTAYHLFFQLEREYILQTTKGDAAAASSRSQTQDDRPIGKQIDDEMPFRYRYIHLSPNWYASGSGKRNGNGKPQAKRKHRRTHGKISFLDLSKRIAERWAALEENDNATKLYVQKIAARELEVYKRKMKVFKASCDAEAAVSTSEQGRVKVSSGLVPVTPPSPTKSVKFEASVKFPKQARVSKQDAAKTSSGMDMGNPEFSFHPIPSSFWRKYKNRAKSGKIPSGGSKMAHRSAPYTYAKVTSRHSNTKDKEYIKSTLDKPHRNYNSVRTDLKSEVPPIGFTLDDVSGLMKVLSDEELQLALV